MFTQQAYFEGIAAMSEEPWGCSATGGFVFLPALNIAISAREGFTTNSP